MEGGEEEDDDAELVQGRVEEGNGGASHGIQALYGRAWGGEASHMVLGRKQDILVLADMGGQSVVCSACLLLLARCKHWV